MFTKNLSKFFIMVVIVAIALLTASFTASPKDSQPYQDYAQRHPGGVMLSAVSSAEEAISEITAKNTLDTRAQTRWGMRAG